MRFVLVTVLSCVFSCAVAQFADIPVGQVTLKDLNITAWPSDTSASAVVLNEIGQAYIDMNNNILVFDMYQKIKILTPGGLSQADFEIPLYKKDNTRQELLKNVTATTYWLDNTSMKSSQMDAKKVFSSTRENGSISRFTLPDVRVGSVIEVRYRIESPFYYNFRTWEFQSDIPKAHSQFTAQTPANYEFAITLRGFLKLSKNEMKLVKECFKEFNATSDCSVATYQMEDIPAFKEEKYMTAEKNFLSAIYFELIQVRQFDGTVHRYAMEWKDVDANLKADKGFGKQVKKARSVLEVDVKNLVAGETDDLVKAKKIYDFIKRHYTWNGENDLKFDTDVKAAYDSKKGSNADINLSMTGALQEAGLNADPVILSTRANGLPTEIHPVLTTFNYVIASVLIGKERYLLDGTNEALPFGVLPTKCINGRGRLIGEESSWVELNYKEKFKRHVSVDLSLVDGHFGGKVVITEKGYEAVNARNRYLDAESKEAFFKKLQHESGELIIKNGEIENLKEIDNPFIEKADISMEDEPGAASMVYISPFFFNRIEKNPFVSSERLYPVDFIAPIEHFFAMSLTIPESMTVEELPKNAAVSLPAGGGKYLFSITQIGNKLNIVSSLYLNKAVYNSTEYHYLKELYARILQIQQSQIVLRRK